MSRNLIGISGCVGNGKDTVGDIIQFLTCENRSQYTNFIEWTESLEQISYWSVKKYADKLKDLVCLLIGCTRKQLEDRTFKEAPLGPEWEVWEGFGRITGKRYLSMDGFKTVKPANITNVSKVVMTPRLLMQLLGTECGRQILHPNIWVNAMFADYTEQSSWLVTDVRFPANEGEGITNRGGINIGVKRKFSLRYPQYADLEEPETPYAIPTELYKVDEKLFNALTHESETAMGDFSWCDYVIENNGTMDELVAKVEEVLLKEGVLHEQQVQN